MLKKYKPFLRAGAIDTMTYRFNIMIWAVITVCQVACMVFLWLAVYHIIILPPCSAGKSLIFNIINPSFLWKHAF